MVWDSSLMVSKTYPCAPSMLKVTFLYDQIINKSHENNLKKKQENVKNTFKITDKITFK